MNLRQGALLAASFALLIGPTVPGLVSTERVWLNQLAEHSFDGRRYVLSDPSELHVTLADGTVPQVLLRLLDVLVTCCDHPISVAQPGGESVLDHWVEQARLLDLEADVLAGHNELLDDTEATVVAVMQQGRRSRPLVIFAADGHFVHAYEPETGHVLFLRRAFEREWTGVVVKVGTSKSPVE